MSEITNMTAIEFRKLYGIPQSSFYAGLKRGTMPLATRVGGRLMVLAEDHIAWRKRIRAEAVAASTNGSGRNAELFAAEENGGVDNGK